MRQISNRDADALVRIASQLRPLRPDNTKQRNAIRVLQQIANKIKRQR